MQGKKRTVPGIEFGEEVVDKRMKGQKLEKLNARWEYGIFVGMRRKSNEVMIATEEGIEEVRSVRKLPKEQRWGEDTLNWVKWAPWRKYKDAIDADGDLPEGVPVEERSSPEEARPDRVVFVDTRERAPRQFYITMKDLEKHKPTRGCGGCSSMYRGAGRQPHSEECRERFRKLLENEAKVKNAEERRREFEEKEIEKNRRKKEKKEEKKRRREEKEEDYEEEVQGRLHREEASSSAEGGVAQMGGPPDQGGGEEGVEMDIGYVEVESLIENWVKEIQEVGVNEEDGEQVDWRKAWDDVKGGELKMMTTYNVRCHYHNSPPPYLPRNLISALKCNLD